MQKSENLTKQSLDFKDPQKNSESLNKLLNGGVFAIEGTLKGTVSLHELVNFDLQHTDIWKSSIHSYLSNFNKTESEKCSELRPCVSELSNSGSSYGFLFNYIGLVSGITSFSLDIHSDDSFSMRFYRDEVDENFEYIGSLKQTKKFNLKELPIMMKEACSYLLGCDNNLERDFIDLHDLYTQ